MWNENVQRLEGKVQVNNKMLKDITFDKAVSTFNKLLGLFILGRDLALVYGAISFITAIRNYDDLVYSIPAFLAGVAMVWSFFSHLSLKKPDYSRLSILELQKAIFNFRKHSAKNARYDIAIVCFWIATLAPFYVKAQFGIEIYSSLTTAVWFVVGIFVLTFISVYGGRFMYQKYEAQLSEAEGELQKIHDFEKEGP
jgi:hypothetical protein